MRVRAQAHSRVFHSAIAPHPNPKKAFPSLSWSDCPWNAIHMPMGYGELTPDAAAEEAGQQLAHGARRIAIVGRPGSGRSLALDRLAEKLDGATPPVRLALSRADDAAFVGIFDLARQLVNDDSSVIELVRDPRERWSKKLAETLRVLGQKQRTILFEDPVLGRVADGSPSIFTLRAQELTTAVSEIASASIVYAAALTDPISKKIHVRAGSNPVDVLDQMRWSLPLLREAAHKLVDRAVDLSRYSPLELRLAVACVASGTPVADIVKRRWSPGELVSGALSNSGSSRLRRIVGFLAQCRVPFELALASEVLDEEVPAEELRLLEEALLIRLPQGFLVHEVVARHANAEGWAGEYQHAVHGKLARWHRTKFDETTHGTDVGKAMRHEIEVVHHLTEAGDAVGVLGATVFFSEQYDALGKALSVLKRYDDAVKAYERALDYDDEDAYAHHYLAFNLDVPGRDAARVYSEFSRARDLQREHIWYHSRLISFLITVGRVLDAEDAWAQALGELSTDESGPLYQ